jgi:hypothetical protein
MADGGHSRRREGREIGAGARMLVKTRVVVGARAEARFEQRERGRARISADGGILVLTVTVVVVVVVVVAVGVVSVVGVVQTRQIRGDDGNGQWLSVGISGAKS